VQTCECCLSADLPRSDFPADIAASCLFRCAVSSTDTANRLSRLAIRPIDWTSRPNTALSCEVTSFSVLSSVVGCPLTITNTTAMQRVTEYLQLTKFIPLVCVHVTDNYIVFLFLCCDTHCNNVTFVSRQEIVACPITTQGRRI